MEKRYRLLAVGESWGDVAGCEILTVSAGWRSASGYGTVQAHTVPMRRPDDGKGKYLLCGSIEGTEFWIWGVGWIKWDRVEANLPSSVTIWRRPREVEKLNPGLWVVVSYKDKQFMSWDAACKSAKEAARSDGDGREWAVAHIDRTFRCVVEVVEKEVSK